MISARNARNATLLALCLYVVSMGTYFLSDSYDSKYSPLDNNGKSNKLRLLKVGKGSKTEHMYADADIMFTATLEAPIEVPLSDIEAGVALLIPGIETEISSTIKFATAFAVLKDSLLNDGYINSLVGAGDTEVEAKNVGCKSSKKGSKSERKLKGSKSSKESCKFVTATLEDLAKVEVLITPFETGCTAAAGNACYELEAAITVLFSGPDVTNVVTDVITGANMPSLIETSFENAGISTDNVVIVDATLIV